MTTYAANLAATQQEGLPEFYRFKAGNVFDYMTSWPVAQTFLGHDYTPSAIKRSGFTKDSQFAAVKLTLEAYMTTRFLRYIANHPIEPIEVVIYRASSSDLTSYAIIFKGEILSLDAKGNHVTAQCESGSRKLRKRLPRILCQAFCNHDVFDSGCALNSYTYRVTAVVGSLTGRTMVAAAAAGYADDYFAMGVVQFGTDYRLITAHTGSTLTLHATISAEDVTAGTTVYLLPGCDGDPDTCKTKFNNYAHFLGMPLIPSRNPTVFGVSE